MNTEMLNAVERLLGAANLKAKDAVEVVAALEQSQCEIRLDAGTAVIYQHGSPVSAGTVLGALAAKSPDYFSVRPER